jgi:hypothetical protein
MCVCMNEKREFVCSFFCLLPVASWLFAVEYLRSVCRLSIFAATAWRSEEAKSCVCVFVRVCTCEPPSMVCRIFARHLRARTRCGSKKKLCRKVSLAWRRLAAASHPFAPLALAPYTSHAGRFEKKACMGPESRAARRAAKTAAGRAAGTGRYTEAYSD